MGSWAKGTGVRLELGAVLIGLVGAIYGRSLSNPFVFDDRPSILENETIRRLWPIWEVLQLPCENPVVGRPVANLTLAVNYVLGGWSRGDTGR